MAIIDMVNFLLMQIPACLMPLEDALFYEAQQAVDGAGMEETELDPEH